VCDDGGWCLYAIRKRLKKNEVYNGVYIIDIIDYRL